MTTDFVSLPKLRGCVGPSLVSQFGELTMFIGGHCCCSDLWTFYLTVRLDFLEEFHLFYLFLGLSVIIQSESEFFC